jgi:hypothetical protein
LLFQTPIKSEPVEGHHDLDSLAAEVHAAYFRTSARLVIQWGKRIGRKKRRSIRLGSYDGATKIIRIHPSLDTPFVPRFFIQSIIYHEYLHHVLGPSHNMRFHKHERRFVYHRESKQWLKRNLPFLLGRKEEARRPVLRSRPPIVARPVQLPLFS